METGMHMTFRSQLAVAAVGLLGILVIFLLLRRRRLSEALFYFWLAILAGIILVGASTRIQYGLTRIVGAYDPLSAMLLIALGFLFGASLVYSVLISGLHAKVRDLTCFVAELRLDLDDLERLRTASSAPRDAKDGIVERREV